MLGAGGLRVGVQRRSPGPDRRDPGLRRRDRGPGTLQPHLAQQLHAFRPAAGCFPAGRHSRSEEHTSELQSRSDLVCRLLLEKKNKTNATMYVAVNYMVLDTYTTGGVPVWLQPRSEAGRSNTQVRDSHIRIALASELKSVDAV